MADQSATPPPKDTVTTRTPTPTSPVAIPAEDQNQPVIQDGAADEESKVVADESVTDATLATAAQEEAPKETTPEDKSENDKLTENTAETKVEDGVEGQEKLDEANLSSKSAEEGSAVVESQSQEPGNMASTVETDLNTEKVTETSEPAAPAANDAAVTDQPPAASGAEVGEPEASQKEESLVTSEAPKPGTPAEPAKSDLDGQTTLAEPTKSNLEGQTTADEATENFESTTDASKADISSSVDTPLTDGTKALTPITKPVEPIPEGSKPASPQDPKSTTPQHEVEPVAQQAEGTKSTTPQIDGNKSVTPQASEKGNLSAATSPTKTLNPQVSPTPPPTAQTVDPLSVPSTQPKPPPVTASSQLGQEPSTPSSPQKTALSMLSEADEANIITGNALNMVWSFGLNKAIPMVNLSTDSRSIIMYACAHTGICYNFENNTQKLLQGHNNNISSICVSEDKRWLATADKGPNNCMVIIWDTNTFFPVQTIFDAGDQGVLALALTPDARYLATISAGAPQVLCIWDWTIEGDTALCSATLNPSYGVQNFVLFNPDDTTQIVSNSDSQVIFYAWENGSIEYFCPPLTDEDFNKPVGKYTQSIFLENTNKCLTSTSIGNLVVWASNKPLTKAIDNEPTPNKKALKLVKVQDRGINVLMVVDSQIVMGDMNGHVKLFDQNLNLVHWYQDLNIGPINAISFTYIEKWSLEQMDTHDYPNDCSLVAKALPMRSFVIGSTQSVYAQITPRGTDINVILRNHDSPIHSVITHPSEKKVYIGSYSGLLQIWDYQLRVVIASRKFEKGYMIQCMAIDPRGFYIAVGFTNGVVKVLDALNLQDEDTEVFRYARDAITHISFSHDSQFLATADGEFTTTLFKRQYGTDVQPWVYIGRHRAHYKEIKDVCFGIELDSNKPRLLTLGKDRNLVEYDLENSHKDHLLLLGKDRIEQSAVPQCIAWYPPLNKEHFIVTANDQYKFKLYNVTTKRCRKTVLGPTYGSPLKKICILPTADEVNDKQYMVYINDDKVGLQILPLDGNPHNSMALVAHPGGVTNLATSFDGKYLFTAGGPDTSVHMWHININALEAQSKLGGEDLVPFYGLMEGGREGELFAELEDYFYYAQLRHQGINTMMKRQVDVKIALSEVPYVMRAMGFYPSEQEVEDMLNEVKFSRYVETGEDVTDIDLGAFIKLYINHRPAFGLSHEKIAWCFDVLSGFSSEESSIKRGKFLDLLQRKGEHMTEYELSEYLTTLLGYNDEGGSCEEHVFDPTEAGSIIVDNLPIDMSTKTFTDDLLGFGFYQQPDILDLEAVDT